MPKKRVSRRAREVCAFVGANVRRIRLARSLSQEKLAELSDLDVRSLQLIEAGFSNLGVAVLVEVADALHVPASRLLRPTKIPERKIGRPPKRRT
jgi:transcriptional regulator with XRE-family HTH domain